jgi:CheY-like chemotaxis protein
VAKGWDVTESRQQLTPGTTLPAKTSVVLLIDDNAIQATIRQTILRRAGYFVIAALDPTRALQQFQQDKFPAVIDAVITDHVMPGMNGAQFVRELRKTHPELPVMVISGLDDAEGDYTGLHVRFLQKPLMPDLLLDNLHDLLQPDQQSAA